MSQISQASQAKGPTPPGAKEGKDVAIAPKYVDPSIPVSDEQIANHPGLVSRPPTTVTEVEIRQIILTIQKRENEGESLVALKAKMRMYEKVLGEIALNEKREAPPHALARAAMMAAKIEHGFLPIR